MRLATSDAKERRATTSRNQSSATPPAPRLTLTITRGVFSRASTRSLSWSVVQGRGYLCSFCQTTSKLHTLPVMRTRTVPSRSILPPATISLASPPCTAAARITNSPCDPIVPSKWEWWPRRLVNSARPCAATSGPPMSFPHRAFTGGVGVDETNAYVPSNAVVAVESAWVCAPAAATKLKIPPIASNLILFVI